MVLGFKFNRRAAREEGRANNHALNKKKHSNNPKRKKQRDSGTVKTERDDTGSVSSSAEIATARGPQSEQVARDEIVTSGSIRFNLGTIVYHDDELRDMDSEEEWNSQWYQPEQIKSFRQEQVMEAGNMFENSFRLSQEELGHVEAWKSVLVDVYQDCVDCSDLSKDTAEEEDTRKEPSEALVQLYRNERASSRLVGLETNILARLRGKARRNIRFILDEISNVTAHREPHHRHNSLLMEEEVSTVSSVTAPSLDFLHRLALAQAAALARDEAE